MVDNAHGAYLRFLSDNAHPIQLGADICCDSAHKTLPVLTGGAYLHVAGGHAQELCKYAKSALSLFATTSPSYLILASLDRCNAVLNGEYCDDLRQTIAIVQDLRDTLTENGWCLTGNEPMKLTIKPKSFGYTGTELASILQKQRIYVEFADQDNLVLMPSVNTPAQDLAYVRDVLCNLPRRPEIHAAPPFFPIPETILQPHEVLLSPAEELPLCQCKGRICAEFAVSCPPAVPIVMAGECINGEAVSAMQYYGVKSCKVIR
jgi:arginine/lysine/ornithine decarboxylase